MEGGKEAPKSLREQMVEARERGVQNLADREEADRKEFKEKTEAELRKGLGKMFKHGVVLQGFAELAMEALEKNPDSRFARFLDDRLEVAENKMAESVNFSEKWRQTVQGEKAFQDFREGGNDLPGYLLRGAADLREVQQAAGDDLTGALIHEAVPELGYGPVIEKLGKEYVLGEVFWGVSRFGTREVPADLLEAIGKEEVLDFLHNQIKEIKAIEPKVEEVGPDEYNEYISYRDKFIEQRNQYIEQIEAYEEGQE